MGKQLVNHEVFNKIGEVLREEAKSLLSAHFDTVDPNWRSALVFFPCPLVEPPHEPCRLFSFEDPQAEENALLRKQPQFRSQDLLPESAVVNGPERGDVDFRDKILEILSEPLLAWLRVAADFENNARFLDVFNPKSQVQLINGRTVVHFEHCYGGVVQNYNREQGTFEVLVDRCLGKELDPEERSVEKYTVEQLREELTMDAFQGQACGITYLPPEK